MADIEQFGLTPAGFRLKRLRDILDSVKNKMKEIEDPETHNKLQVDFEENDPFIQFINLVCDELATIWELLNGAYDQFDPLKATGPMLSALVQLNGITRKQGSPSKVYVRFYGRQNTVVPIGTRVTDNQNKLIWKVVNQDLKNETTDLTTRTINIPDESTFYALILCETEENGAFQISANEIQVLLDDVPNVTSVVNPSASLPGLADETDISLRRRREKSTETPSQGIAESIYAGIIGLQKVEYCKVFTNRTLDTDSRGIPPKSIAVVVKVQDGYEQDSDLKELIGNTIFLRSSLGEDYYGTQEVTYTDSFGQKTEVRFIYPEKIPVYIDVTVTNLEGTQKTYSVEQIVTQIKNNIQLFAKEGVQGLGIENKEIFDSFGFPPAENIDFSRLYTPINAVPGIKVLDMNIGTSQDSLSKNDIPIDWYQMGEFLDSYINVNYIETKYQ